MMPFPRKTTYIRRDYNRSSHAPSLAHVLYSMQNVLLSVCSSTNFFGDLRIQRNAYRGKISIYTALPTNRVQDRQISNHAT